MAEIIHQKVLLCALFLSTSTKSKLEKAALGMVMVHMDFRFSALTVFSLVE